MLWVCLKKEKTTKKRKSFPTLSPGYSMSFIYLYLKNLGVPVVVQQVTNPTSIHEDVGLIPILT